MTISLTSELHATVVIGPLSAYFQMTWCAALSVVADAPQPAAAYRERLAVVELLRHVTVEVHRCPGCTPA